MKYYAHFAAKLAAIGGLMFLLLKALQAAWPEPIPFHGVKLNPFATDLEFTLIVMAIALVGVALVCLAILDQRYRCRACLTRLRMPVSQGAWNQIIFGAPRTEYICPFGHGTLRVPDLHLASPEQINWRPNEDMWKELYELEESRK
jgi:hypothetical protein